VERPESVLDKGGECLTNFKHPIEGNSLRDNVECD